MYKSIFEERAAQERKLARHYNGLNKRNGYLRQETERDRRTPTCCPNSSDPTDSMTEDSQNTSEYAFPLFSLCCPIPKQNFHFENKIYTPKSKTSRVN